jgi:uncharacterized protein YbbC (DUF1343 family)
MVTHIARYGALWLMFPKLEKNLTGKVFVGVETVKHNEVQQLFVCSELLTERFFKQ